MRFSSSRTSFVPGSLVMRSIGCRSPSAGLSVLNQPMALALSPKISTASEMVALGCNSDTYIRDGRYVSAAPRRLDRSRPLERPVTIHEFHAKAAGFAIDGAHPAMCEPLEQPLTRVFIFQCGRALERALRSRQLLSADLRHHLFAQVRENDDVPRTQQREGGSEFRRVLIAAVGHHHHQSALSSLRKAFGRDLFVIGKRRRGL